MIDSTSFLRLTSMRSISFSAADRPARCSIRSRFISRVNSSQNSSNKSCRSSLSCSAEHASFNLVAPDGQVVVAPPLARAKASEAVIGFADVTSHEETTREWLRGGERTVV